MKTSQQQTLRGGEDLLTFSQEDSLVSHFQQQVNEKERRMTDTSGRKCLEQLQKFSRVGSWARMFSGLLIGQGIGFRASAG